VLVVVLVLDFPQFDMSEDEEENEIGPGWTSKICGYRPI
jgi:hypothetical protein